MTQATSSISQTSPSLVAVIQGMSFSDLPADMILEVLARSNVSSIGTLRLTSRHFDAMFQVDENWRTLFHFYFPTSVPPFQSFKDSFIDRHHFHTNFTQGAFTTRQIKGERPTGDVNHSLAFFGTKVITGSNHINIYDSVTGSRVSQFPGDGQLILALLVSGDLLFAASSRVINVYNLSTESHVKTLSGHSRAVTCLRMVEENLISGSLDSTIRIWNVSTGESQCLEGHTEGVTSLVISPERILYSGSRDKTIRVWDLKEKEFLNVHVLGTHEHGVMDLALDGENLVSCSWERTFKFWDLKKRECLHSLTDTKPLLFTLASCEGKFASSSNDRTLKLWDRDRSLHMLDTGPWIFQNLAFRNDQLFAASIGMIWCLDFRAKDTEIFAEIAEQFKNPKLQNDAMLRFDRMPKKAKREIFLHLHRIIAPGDSLGNPSDAFLELRWDSATPAQKAQAIEAYVAGKGV